MALDIFLKLNGVTGESQDNAHKQEIDVLNWAWGMSNMGSTHVGSGGGTGKVSVKDLIVEKYIDSSSPKLMGACCDGTHFSDGVLTVRKAGGQGPLEYVKIKLNEVLITSVSTGGTSGGPDRLTENISLNFAKVTVQYVPQRADGNAATMIPFGWDIAANKKL